VHTTEIKIGGLGGQGVILSAMIIGRGASIYDTKHATLTQSFGPEARGSACSASIIVSDEPIEYPYVTNPDILVVLSQEACNRFGPELAPDGLLLYESELVEPGDLPEGVRRFGVPSTRIAEQLRRSMVANIVMVGFFTALTDLVGPDALRESVKSSVPPGTESLNLEAFDRGHRYGLEVKAGKTPAEIASRA